MPEPVSLDTYQMSAADVATALGVSLDEVYNRLARGVIPGHRAGRNGGRWVVLRREFERWLAEGPSLEPTTQHLQLGDLVGHTLDVVVNGIPLSIHIRGVSTEPHQLGLGRAKGGK